MRGRGDDVRVCGGGNYNFSARVRIRGNKGAANQPTLALTLRCSRTNNVHSNEDDDDTDDASRTRKLYMQHSLKLTGVLGLVAETELPIHRDVNVLPLAELPESTQNISLHRLPESKLSAEQSQRPLFLLCAGTSRPAGNLWVSRFGQSQIWRTSGSGSQRVNCEWSPLIHRTEWILEMSCKWRQWCFVRVCVWLPELRLSFQKDAKAITTRLISTQVVSYEFHVSAYSAPWLALECCKQTSG